MQLKITSSETLDPTKLCTNKILRAAAVRHNGTLTLPLSRRIKLFIRTHESVCVVYRNFSWGKELEEDAMGGKCSGHGRDIAIQVGW